MFEDQGGRTDHIKEMADNFPIDIQLKKMTDWLVSRRICQKNWHAGVVNVREKIGEAIRDMPEHPAIKDMLSATNVNYYNCKAILEVLMETEKDSKNVFGLYTSSRIADWRKIISLYEKDSCYLPEASNYLSQAVVYEIPSIRKHIAKLEKQLNDLDKEESSWNRKITETLAARQSDCAVLGIAGKEPKKEIMEIINCLPELYDKWVANAKLILMPLAKKYSMAASQHRPVENCLPALNFLLEKGNVTAYEYIHGEAPLKIEASTWLSNLMVEEEKGEDAGICLDLEAVDLDLDVSEPTELGEIDWGDEGVAGEGGLPTDAIDWGDEDISAQIVVEDSGTSGGVATGSEAMTILDNLRLRNLVLDDLNELSVFCSLRRLELSQERSFSLNDNLVGEETSDDWQLYQSQIDSLLEKLNGPGQLHQLHLVKSSTSFVHRLVSEMQHKLNIVSRMEAKIDQVRSTRTSVSQEIQVLQKTSHDVLEKTCQLQKHLEDDVSRRYNQRPCHILGGVQSL